MQHDTPGETAQPGGVVRDWKRGDVPAIPGKTMPSGPDRGAGLHRDRRQARRVGPLADKLGFTTKNVTFRLEHQVAQLAASGGVMLGGAADGRPAIDTDAKMAEAILTFSGTTNGELAVQGFETLESGSRQAAYRSCCMARRKSGSPSRRPSRPRAGDHLARVVGIGDRRPSLRPVHRQRGAAQALAHADRPDALLP